MSDVHGEFEGALHWQGSLADEPPEVTEQKRHQLEILHQNGIYVPGILFTESQALQAIGNLVEEERKRYSNPDLDYNPLYVTITPGGDRLANALYSGISMFANGRVDNDSIGINPKDPRSERQTHVLKNLDERTKIYDRDIVFVDSSIRSGTLLKTIARRFMEPDWTVRNLPSGGVPKSISAFSLTARDDVSRSDFPELDRLFVGLITPSGVRTAGWGANDIDEYLRMLPDVVVAPHQNDAMQARVQEVIRILGVRASTDIEIQYLPQIK